MNNNKKLVLKNKMNKHDYAIETINLSKFFGKFCANKQLNIKIKSNEIHGILGENGAGKSVLTSMFVGTYLPTTGSIKIFGHNVFIENGKKAQHLKIGMLQQHYQLVENYKVWQNIALGNENTSSGFLNIKKIKQKIQKIMTLYHLSLKLNAVTSSLTVSGHQKVAILKLLYKNPDILIFDEPTSVLTTKETEKFWLMFQSLKKEGKTIILITHKIAEVIKVADTVTILSQGQFQGTFEIKEKITKEFLVDKMFKGVNTTDTSKVIVKDSNKNENESPILLLKDVNLKVSSVYKLKNINFKIYAGEIIGIVGINNNGQDELVDIITGLSKKNKGLIKLNNIDITHKSAKFRFYNGISYVPEDRSNKALVLDFNVVNNVALNNIDKYPFNKYGIVRNYYIEKYTQELIKEYNVYGAHKGFAQTRYISGGNQQKIVLGRALKRKHNLLILVSPSQGLDQKSINFVHNEIIKAKDKGGAIILVSYDLSEILRLSSRIFVMINGKIIKKIINKNQSLQKIGNYIATTSKKEFL